MIFSVAPTVFWLVVGVIPQRSGEDYLHFLTWEVAGLLSTLSVFPILYIIGRTELSKGWTFILIYNLSPALFGLLLIVYTIVFELPE